MLSSRNLFVLTLCVCTAAASLRNLSDDPPLAIKGMIHKNDDPHEQREKKDFHGQIITPRIVGGTTVAPGDYLTLCASITTST